MAKNPSDLEQEKPIVLFEGNNKAIISAIRSYEEFDIPYYICLKDGYIHERLFWNVSPYREHILDTIHRQEDLSAPDKFMNTVRNIYDEIGEYIIFPINDEKLTILMDNEEKLRSLGIELPLPAKDTWVKMAHKEEFYKTIQNYGLRSPPQIPIGEATPPIVAKPKADVSSDGTRYRTQILLTGRDLSKFRKEFDTDKYVLQEYIKGHEKMYYSFWDNGTLVQSFCRSKVVQGPNGETTILVRPSEISSNIIERINNMMSDLNWHGPIRITFIEKENKPYMIEANARFGGTIELSRVNHCPMPVLLFDMYNDTSIFEERTKDSKKELLVETYLMEALITRLTAGGRFRKHDQIGWAPRTTVFLKRDTFYNLFVLEVLNKMKIKEFLGSVLPDGIKKSIRSILRK